MNFVYIFHRFHTNQYFATKELINHGHNVYYIVKYKDLAEDYTYVDPIILSNGKLSTWIFKFVKYINPEVNRDLWKKYGIPNIFKFTTILIRLHPHFVIIRDFNFTSILSVFACKLFCIPSVLYTSRSKYKEESSSSWKSKLFEFGCKVGLLPKMIITPVQGDITKSSKTQSNIYYIPHCIKVNSKAKNRGYFKKGVINIFTIGKYSLERKRLDLALRAVNELKKDYKIHLTILGSYKDADVQSVGGYERLEEYIVANKLQSMVTLLKNYSYKDTLKEYISHDVFLFPSSNEPNGVSHLEAMSCGLPVILSNTNGTRNYIEDGYNGYIFKSDDLNDLIKKLRLLIKNKDNIINMGKNSIERVTNYYTPLITYNQFMDALKKEYPNKFRNA